MTTDNKIQRLDNLTQLIHLIKSNAKALQIFDTDKTFIENKIILIADLRLFIQNPNKIYIF